MNTGLTIIRFNYRNNVLKKAQIALFNKQKACAFIFKYRKKTEIKPTVPTMVRLLPIKEVE